MEQKRIWTESKIIRISREPSSLQIMTDQKQAENVEYFNCLGSMITNDARCTREVKSMIVMAKAAFNIKNALFTRKLELHLQSEVLHLKHSFVWYRNLDTSESRSEIPGKF
jgi:hypothetical protein